MIINQTLTDYLSDFKLSNKSLYPPLSSYWLLSIAFIRLGDATDKGDMIENMELVNKTNDCKTCNADCNLQYDYT